MHIHLLWSFGLLLFPHYDLPLPVCLPLSRSLCQFLSIFVSLALSFPTARPSFILIPPPPWVFYCLPVFFSLFKGEFLFLKEVKTISSVGIAEADKLNTLCWEWYPSFIPYACLGHVYAHMPSAIFNFFPLFWTCNSSLWLFLKTHFNLFGFIGLLQKLTRCTYSSSCTHGTDLLPISSTRPPLASLLSLHPSAGTIICPPLIPAQPHTLSKTTFIPQCTCIPHVSTVPQCPRLSAYSAPGSCESRTLSSSSCLFLSAPHFGDIRVIYFTAKDSIWIPFLHHSHATQLLSPYLLECSFYNTSGHHNTTINSIVSAFLLETHGLNSPRQRKWLWKKLLEFAPPYVSVIVNKWLLLNFHFLSFSFFSCYVVL